MKFKSDISGLCPWCKAASKTLIHLFWTCPIVKSYWFHITQGLNQVFKDVKLAAHMVLLGRVRQHSAELFFCWPLIRVVSMQHLWTARNKVIFNKDNSSPSQKLAIGSLKKIENLLCIWPGKGGEEARKIGSQWKKRW
eukprot:c8667_g1_i1 orf=22-435(+)